ARFISWPHLVAAIITVLVALFSELTTAIFTGVILSLTLYTLTMADTLKVFALERVSPGTWREVPPPARLEPGTVTVLEVSGSAYFASTYRASQLLPDHDSTEGAGVVLQMRNRRFYSLTGVDYVLEMVRDLRQHGHVVVLSDVDPGQQETMEKTGIIAQVGPDNIVWRDPILGRAIDAGYDRAV